MIYSKIKGRRNPKVKVPPHSFSEKSQYHVRYGVFSTLEWEVHVIGTRMVTEEGVQYSYTAIVRNMQFCYTGEATGHLDVVQALNQMFGKRLGVTFE